MYMIPGASASNPGSGSRLQLAAVGKQDGYVAEYGLPGLEVSPRTFPSTTTPFRAAFRRATRFATWTDAVAMEYTPGKRSQIDIPKSGDLLADMYLEITLPAVAAAPAGATWNKLVGYTLLRRVRLLLDDQEIHNFERLWYDLYDHLYTRAGHERGLDRMVGRTPLPMNRSHLLYVPLRMLTCRKGAARSAIPLQAISRAALKLDIEWEVPGMLSAHTPTDPGIAVSALVEYVELEDPEKTQFVRGATLAFESTIDSDALSYYIDSDGDVRDRTEIKVNLGNVRYAVKMLVWVAYAVTATEQQGELFTYIDDPLDTVNIAFNNQERLNPVPSDYFTVLQKYQSCIRGRPGPPSVYSFALNATSRFPSGSADFGALAAVALHGHIAPGTPQFKLKVFSVYYNVLQIGSGTASVMFV